MQGHAPGRRAKVSKGPSAKVQGLRGRGQFANGQEAADTDPTNAPPNEIEKALGVAPVEARHVATAADLRDGTEADNRVLSLLFGVLRAVLKEAFDLRRLPGSLPVVSLDNLIRVLGGSIAVEVEDFWFEVEDAGGAIGLWHDVRVNPIVVVLDGRTLTDVSHLLQCPTWQYECRETDIGRQYIVRR